MGEELNTNKSLETKSSNDQIEDVQSIYNAKKDDTLISFKVSKKHLKIIVSLFALIVLVGLTGFLGYNIGTESGKKVGYSLGYSEGEKAGTLVGYSQGEKAANTKATTKELDEKYAKGYIDSYRFNGIGGFDDVKPGWYIIKVSVQDKEPTVGGLFDFAGNVKIKDTSAGSIIKQPFYKITNLTNMGPGTDYFIKNNEVWVR